MSFAFASHVGGLAQSVECVVSNDEAPGSKPGFSTFYNYNFDIIFIIIISNMLACNNYFTTWNVANVI